MNPVKAISRMCRFMPFLSLAALSPLAAQKPATYDLNFAVSGNPGPDDELNPNYVVYKLHPEHATKVLAFMNYVRPRSLREIHDSLGIPEAGLLKIVSDLSKCDLIRLDTLKGYGVTFAVFDDATWELFDPVMRAVAQEISTRVSSDILPALKARYEASPFKSQGIAFGTLATLVVGAYGLDEYAIESLEHNGLIRIRKPQPGNRDYIVLSWRKGNKKSYPTWGIHGTSWNNVYFGVFGENQVMNRRRKEVRALPDLAWNSRQEKPEIDAKVTTLADLARLHGNNRFALNTLATQLNDWIQAGIIEQGDGFNRLAVPVFDKRPFRETVDSIAALVLSVFRSRYSDLRQQYIRTTAASHGVPIEEVLDLVYHTCYSLAFDEILSANPEMTFSHVDGGLKYTGYILLND